jgi:peptide/nickel transport system substrate-binding protein
MSTDRSMESGVERVLDVATRIKQLEMDRRQLFLRAAAMGAAGALGFTSHEAMQAMAQDTDKNELVTISQDQQQVWVKNFNPFLAAGSVRWPTHWGIHEPLLIFNALTGETVPWLAESWSWSDDALSLTFKIRTGVTWSDGEAFSAQDVLFTFQHLIDHKDLPGEGGARQSLDNFVSKVESPDDTTVVFTLSAPYSPSLWDLGETNIAPMHIWKDIADPVTATNDTPVGTGPFTAIPIFQDQYWELHANPTYWQEGQPAVKGLRFPAFPSNDAANLANTGGETDWFANFIPDIDTAFVAKDPDHNHYFQPAIGAMVMVYANTAHKPFDDINVRKALSMCFDRPKMVELAVYNYTAPGDSNGLGGAYTNWNDQAVIDAGQPAVSLDVDAANALLDAGGYAKDGDYRKTPDGKDMSYKINVVSGWSDWVQVVQIAAQNAKDIGIKLEVEALDYSPWFENVTKGDFDLSIGWSSGGPTPYNYYRGQMSKLTYNAPGTASNENWHRYVSDKGTDLLNQFAATADLDAQKDLMNQIQQIFVDEFPSIVMYPGPQWGQYNSSRFVGFPDSDNPYSVLSTYAHERLIVMNKITPVAAS